MTEYDINAPSSGTNRTAPITDCRTCGGDRFVVVRLRSPDQTQWMTDHGHHVPPDQFHEEVVPCPDCNPIEVSYFTVMGRFRSMDPAAVRQALSQ